MDSEFARSQTKREPEIVPIKKSKQKNRGDNAAGFFNQHGVYCKAEGSNEHENITLRKLQRKQVCKISTSQQYIFP
jgi:hypothetical protein